jgi:hypothetical protein
MQYFGEALHRGGAVNGSEAVGPRISMYFTDILNKCDISFDDEANGGTNDSTEGDVDVQMGDAWYPQFEQTVKRAGSTLDAASLHKQMGQMSATATGGAVRYNTREDSIRTELKPGPQTRVELITSGKLGRRWENTGPRFAGRAALGADKKNLTPSFPAGFVRTKVAKKSEVFKQKEEDMKADYETQQIIPPPPLLVYQPPNSAAGRLWDSGSRYDNLGPGLSPRVQPSMDGKYQLLQLVEAGNKRAPVWRDIASKSERANMRCQTAHQITTAAVASNHQTALLRKAPTSNGEWERQPEAKDFMPRVLRRSGANESGEGGAAGGGGEGRVTTGYAVGSTYKARVKGKVGRNYAAKQPSAVRCDTNVKQFWEGWDQGGMGGGGGYGGSKTDLSSSKMEIFSIIMQEQQQAAGEADQ